MSIASQRTAASREPAKRADGRENRRRLVEAAGKLLSRSEPFTLAEVAARAGLSTATAYRHFRSADDVTEAFVAGFWDQMDTRVAAAGSSLDLRRFCGIWVEAVLEWGPSLVRLRSGAGFLERRRRGDLRVSRLVRLLEPLIRIQLGGSQRGASGEALSYAVSIWNALADPREILDQRTTLGWSARRIAERLNSSVVGALRPGRAASDDTPSVDPASP